jgi:hypothetical protein
MLEAKGRSIEHPMLQAVTAGELEGPGAGRPLACLRLATERVAWAVTLPWPCAVGWKRGPTSAHRGRRKPPVPTPQALCTLADAGTSAASRPEHRSGSNPGNGRAPVGVGASSSNRNLRSGCVAASGSKATARPQTWYFAVRFSSERSCETRSGGHGPIAPNTLVDATFSKSPPEPPVPPTCA